MEVVVDELTDEELVVVVRLVLVGELVVGVAVEAEEVVEVVLVVVGELDQENMAIAKMAGP